MEQNLEPIRKTNGTGIYQVLRYALSFGAGVRQFSRLTQTQTTFHSNLII